MPIYEYQCQSCGNQVEVLQKMNDAPLKDCSACGKADMKKMVSAVAFRLSGSGWYETDFKSGDKKNLASNSDANSLNKKTEPEKATKTDKPKKTTDTSNKKS